MFLQMLCIYLRNDQRHPGIQTVVITVIYDDCAFLHGRPAELPGGSFSSFGAGKKSKVNTRKGVERCIRYAFRYAQKQGRKKLTLCDKANVLTYAHDLWRRAFAEVGKEYPEIKKDCVFVDAVCMWMVKNPEWFEVIVTCNMFGDIITDLGAMIQGGMGIAAGGNINPEGTPMFEPIGGSAPKYTGKNVINPLAAISAVQMMLEYLGEAKAARLIEKAVIKTCTRLDSLSAGKMGYSTTEVGDMVADFVHLRDKAQSDKGTEAQNL